MKYKFIGYPVPYKGKTIWEIVGNLKNFGVGRIIVADENKDKFIEPSFYKILKVQPLDTPKQVGHNRSVILWAEYVLRGRRLKEIEKITTDTELTKYHLIPKEDEAKYLNGITESSTVIVRPRYQTWPPVYKMYIEQKMKNNLGTEYRLPALNTIIDEGEKSFEVLSAEDSTEAVPHSNLYKTEKSVEDLYKEIAALQLKLGLDKETVED